MNCNTTHYRANSSSVPGDPTFCTIEDFVELADTLGAKVESAVALDAQGQRVGMRLPWALWNLFGTQAVFVLKR